MGFMSAEAIARVGYQGCMRDNRVVIPGVMNKVGVQSVRISPRRVATQVARMLQESA
jgi:short-subunit dehydrogenase